MEAFDSAATGADYESAHAFANRFFGRVTILGPVPIDSSRGGVAGLAYSYSFGRNNANVFVVREFDTPIPLQSLPRGAPAPGHVTKVERDKKK